MGQTEKAILDGLTLDDLQENHREIAEVIGVDGLKLLSAVFGGVDLHIPKYKELVRGRAYRLIYEEYDGTNIKKLALKYDVCEATVYKIIRDRITGKSRRKEKQLPGQMTIADMQFPEE